MCIYQSYYLILQPDRNREHILVDASGLTIRYNDFKKNLTTIQLNLMLQSEATV